MKNFIFLFFYFFIIKFLNYDRFVTINKTLILFFKLIFVFRNLPMNQTENPMTQVWVMTHRLGTTALEHTYS